MKTQWLNETAVAVRTRKLDRERRTILSVKWDWQLWDRPDCARSCVTMSAFDVCGDEADGWIEGKGKMQGYSGAKGNVYQIGMKGWREAKCA